ncbi:hypothetical protein QFZ82_007577 [Streptomyces sp. V4I23]|nr:hypothetical protein [Streptomyces sp. V4I23]
MSSPFKAGKGLWRHQDPLRCRMTVLIIGGSGFLGTELVRQAQAAGHATAATFASRSGRASGGTWHALDLREPGRIEALMAEVKPRVVVNATSGYADWEVTAEGPVRLAMAAAQHGSHLIHVSSDAVFSGGRVHYDESCLPDPLTLRCGEGRSGDRRTPRVSRGRDRPHLADHRRPAVCARTRGARLGRRHPRRRPVHRRHPLPCACRRSGWSASGAGVVRRVRYSIWPGPTL